jgi:hypothetical protein
MVNLFVSALFLGLTSFVYGQEKKHESIEGNGKIITRDIPVQSFEELKASGVYELKLSQGDKESVKIEADENLQELFMVRNEGKQLLVEMKKKISLKGKMGMKVYITFKRLSNIELNTVGNVSSENKLSFEDLELNNHSVGNVDLHFTVKNLDLRNKSVGNIKLQGSAQTASFKNAGVGNLRAGELEVQNLEIENNGVGNAEVNAEKLLKVKDNSLGKVTNKGAAPMRKMNKVTI